MMCNVVRSERTSEGALWRGLGVPSVCGVDGIADRVVMRLVKRARGVGRAVVDIAGVWTSRYDYLSGSGALLNVAGRRFFFRSLKGIEVLLTAMFDEKFIRY